MNWYLKVIMNYAGFSGRARRKEYWMFAFINMVFLAIAFYVDTILGTMIEDTYYGLFYSIYGLAVLIPGTALAVRRLHDVNKSGWMYLILLIPFFGAIWFFILMLTDSHHGVNIYGEYPKEYK